MSTIKDVVIINIPSINEVRGKLGVIENDTIPFDFKRVYLYDVPSDSYRGGHAHKEQSEFLIALSGSFEVVLNDGFEKRRIMLNKPNKGLLIPKMLWRELDNFSSGAVCLVLASDTFDEADYLRDFIEFKSFKST